VFSQRFVLENNRRQFSSKFHQQILTQTSRRKNKITPQYFNKQHEAGIILTDFVELSLLENLPVVQRLKNFLTFYGAPKVHSRDHKRPPLVPIPSQINPVQVRIQL
jgi:hypothetical protein